MTQPPCRCRVCLRGRKFKRMLSGLTDKQARYFTSIYESLEITELDHDVLEAIIAGKWPSADEIMKRKGWERGAADIAKRLD